MIDEDLTKATALYENLTQYAQRKLYPFHMPGHKGNTHFMPPINEWLKLDVTELDETDNLHAPQASILETQRRISLFYGADESFLLVNGTTAGIIAAIGAVCNEGDNIAVARNCHRSVFSGMAWAGANPVYFMPEITHEGLAGGVSPGTVRDLLEHHSEIKAVIVTSPTYEGYVSDIKAIADITHRYNCVLIVDEAHGAHFPFHSAFPRGALECGADIVVQSFHKTLPTFSQSAVLHIKGLKPEPTQRLRLGLQCLQTSSPSFMLMAVTDYMLNFLWKETAYFDLYVDSLFKLRNKLSKNHYIHLVEPKNDYCIGKIVLTMPQGIDGNVLSQRLATEFGLKMELSSHHHILAMTSVADSFSGDNGGFIRLAKAISHVDTECRITKNMQESKVMNPSAKQTLPVVILSPRKALKKPTCPALIVNSIGKISGGFVMPYPPGIPILAPGEQITQEVLKAADYYGLSQCEVIV